MDTFDEYYEKFIKPSSDELTTYQKEDHIIKKKIKVRALIVTCILLFIFLNYGTDISESVKQMFETSAKNTNHPTFDKFLGVASLIFLSLIAAFLLLLFIISPGGKYVEELQNKFLPKIIKFFGEDLIFNPDSSDDNFTKNLLNNFGLKEQDGWDSFFYKEEDWNIDEDYSIKGLFNNNKINILSVELTKGSGKKEKNVFEGLLLFNETAKLNSQNKIIIQTKRIAYSKTTLDPQNLKEFFQIYCHEESDNHLLTESLLKYLLTLSQHFSSIIECRIYKDTLLILIKGSDHFFFDSSIVNEQPPFYETSKEIVQKIELLLLAYDF